MNKSDVIGFVAILLMLIGAGMIIYYQVTTEINKCTSDPLKYTAEQIADGENYSYIVIKLYKFKGELAPIKTYELDISNSNIDLNDYIHP